MSEHFFGVGPGHLGRAVATVARQHGAELVNYTEPRGERRHWFACPNLGEPFDAACARDVLAALRANGLLPAAEEGGA